ncbi:MAG TPA: hypothetical protein PKJ84_11355, partial [Anaerolineales bacterium]|nr:hypothetical protein [Anaerolineales bacterium]
MNEKTKYDKAEPTIDEGWWESVLAEENRYSTPTQRLVQSKPEVQKEAGKESVSEEAQITVDWSQIKDLYLKDRIVELTVTGHNRGGL